MFEQCPKCGSKYARMNYGDMEGDYVDISCQDCDYTVAGRDAEWVQDRWRAQSIRAGYKPIDCGDDE